MSRVSISDPSTQNACYILGIKLENDRLSLQAAASVGGRDVPILGLVWIDEVNGILARGILIMIRTNRM